jgi:hypothetical protein
LSVCPTRLPVQLSVGALQVASPSQGAQEMLLASTQEGGAGLQALASVGAPPQQWKTQTWFALHVSDPQLMLPASGMGGWQPASPWHWCTSMVPGGHPQQP